MVSSLSMSGWIEIISVLDRLAAYQPNEFDWQQVKREDHDLLGTRSPRCKIEQGLRHH